MRTKIENYRTGRLGTAKVLGGREISIRSGPDEVPEAFAVEDTDCDIGRELGEKTHQTVRGARRDCRGGDDGEGRCWFGKCLGIGPRLEDGLREQGHKPVRPALGGNFAFNDVALITAGDDDVRTLVGEHRLLLHPPAVLAKEVGEEVLELAPTVRARRVRIGKRGGHVFTLATLIIVAVVIIMAALTVEVKASPVF